MPKKLIEYTLDDGTTLLVEVEESTSIQGGLVPISADTAPAKADRSFKDAIKQIKPTATLLLDQLNELKADEVEVEFGLKLSSTAGIVIASGNIEANYQVTLKWNNQSK